MMTVANFPVGSFRHSINCPLPSDPSTLTTTIIEQQSHLSIITHSPSHQMHFEFPQCYNFIIPGGCYLVLLIFISIVHLVHLQLS